jgi:hypothetical protein
MSKSILCRDLINQILYYHLTVLQYVENDKLRNPHVILKLASQKKNKIVINSVNFISIKLLFFRNIKKPDTKIQILIS